MRALGIPTVLDRFIQQAVLQVLQADWDRNVLGCAASASGRGARRIMAVAKAQEHIALGYGIVVDLDLEKFFDRVNHDVLMGLVAKRVSDKRLLKLIRGFLSAGVLEGGLVGPTEQGTPQGGADHALNAKDNLRVLMPRTCWILAAPRYEASWL